MIDFVEGTIAYLDSEYVVVETGGIGYRLFCPNPYAYAAHEGERRRFFTHHHVREDAIHLYGFATRDERELYRKLLEVSGIGPKGGLAILAGATPEQIVLAIQQENVNYLTKFPGIGKKTAQRIIIDLKDKLKGYAPTLSTAVTAASPYVDPAGGTSLDEAIDALIALGYTDVEIQRIKGQLAEQAQSGASTEKLIKQGLALLLRG
jgi:Holliday junction DNA helicase RuvA